MSDFRRMLDRYLNLGVNLLSLAIGCAVKVDLYEILYPAISRIKHELTGLNIEIMPREDVAILSGVDDYEIARRVYRLPEVSIDPRELEALRPDVTILLLQVHQSRTASPEEFAKIALSLYRSLGGSGARVRIGKGHSIISTKPGAEFALLDHIRITRKGDNYLLANNDTIQIIDPMEDPGSYRQVATSVSNALNDLFVKGVHEDITIYPTYDAPTEELRAQLLNNYREFSRNWGFRIIDDLPQPAVNYLLMGATVAGRLSKEPPMFYSEVRDGFKVMVTRPFGELSIITTYLTAHVDEELRRELEANVMSLEELGRIKGKIMDILATPNVELGRIISKYLPERGSRFRPEEHIAVTIDVSGPGIFVFKEIAEQSGVDIRLNSIPLVSGEIAEFAASHYVVTDATAGTNGAIAILASSDVIESLLREVRRVSNTEPQIIGEVVGKGDGKLLVPSYIGKYIASKSLLAKLTSGVDVLKSMRIREATVRKVRAEVRVYGDVQGVGLRPMIKREALSLGLTGYARNMPDGSVEIVAEGGEEEVKALIEWLRKSPVGRVDKVEYIIREYSGSFSDFEIR